MTDQGPFVWNKVKASVKPIFPVMQFELILSDVILDVSRAVSSQQGIVYRFAVVLSNSDDDAIAQYFVDQDRLVCTPADRDQLLRYRHYIEGGEGIPVEFKLGLDLLLEKLAEER